MKTRNFDDRLHASREWTGTSTSLSPLLAMVPVSSGGGGALHGKVEALHQRKGGPWPALTFHFDQSSH